MIKPISLITLATLGALIAAKAELVEDFETYSPGILAGQDSRIPGLNGTWSGTGEAEVVAGAAGNVLRVHPTGHWTGIAFDLESSDSPFRGMSGILGDAPGSELYLSFHIEFESTQTKDAQAYFALTEVPNGQNGLLFGQIWNSSTFSGSFGQPSSVPIDEEAHFVVIRLQRHGGGSIAAEVYLNPEHPFTTALSEQEPLVQLWPKAKTFKFLQFKANANSFLVDNIMIGESPQDVFRN
jgi:hypothetical protein